MLLLAVAAIVLLLVIILIVAGTSQPAVPVLASTGPLLVPETTAEASALTPALTFYNMSVRKTNPGYSGVIRSLIAAPNQPEYSHPYTITLDEQGVVTSLAPIDLGAIKLAHCTERHGGVLANGLEDPRIFTLANEDWVIANMLGSASQHHPCVNVMCVFRLRDPAATLRQLQPPVGVDPEWCQKNWSPFQYGDELYCEYSLNPHVILAVDPTSGHCRHAYQTKFEVNNKHSLRGGAPPVFVNDCYLGLGHTRTKAAGYVHFFYTFAAQPPFAITGLSPLCKLDDNARIQFAAGLSIQDETVYVSYGVADSYNRIAQYPLADVLARCQDPR